MAYRPRSTRYSKVGSYLGQVFQPKPLNTAGVTFRPCWIGKGDRLALTRNASVPRAWITEEQLTFSATAPYVATLGFAAKPDQNSPVSLYDTDGNEVPTSRWRFYQPGGVGTAYTQILFNAADYDRTRTYYIDYQSALRTPLDPFPFTDERRVIRVGKFPNQDYYQESLAPATDGKDYLVPGHLDTFTVGSATTNKTPTVSTITHAVGGTGTVAFGASNAYALNGTRYYRLLCTAAAATYATGSLAFTQASISNNEHFIISNGTDTVTFEFHVTGGHVPVAGRVEMDVSGAATDNAVAVIVRAAINNAANWPGARNYITAASPGITNTFTLTQTRYGTAANVTIEAYEADGTTPSVGVVPTGMAGGTAMSSTFSLSAYNHSGLNGVQPQVPLAAGMVACTFTVTSEGTGATSPTNRALIDGIYLTFSFGLLNFNPTDTASFFGYGPAYTEAHSAFSTSNAQFPAISTPAAVGVTTWTANPPSVAANTATATCAISSAADYTGEYVRHYTMQVNSVSTNAFAVGLLTFVLADITDNEYFTLHNGLETVTFEFEVTGGYTPVAGRVGIDITAAGSNADVAAAARAAINAAGSWTDSHNYVVAGVPAGGTIALTQTMYGTAANHAITAFESAGAVSVGITHVGMAGGTRGATVYWAGRDELPYTSVSFTVDEATPASYTNLLLELGVRITWTLPAFPDNNAFVLNNTWSFTARPGRQYYNAKDDRVYTITAGTAAVRSLPGTYSSSTVEGGFDAFTATCLANGLGGQSEFMDNVKVMFRNLGNALDTPTGINAPTRWTAGDTYTFAATCDDVIDWNIDVRTTETVAATGLLTDATGSITGTAGATYLVLDNTPLSVLSVINDSSVVVTDYHLVTGMPYVYFDTDPTAGAPLAVRYQHKGKEPEPGSIYYVTGTRLRNRTTEYNAPLLWRSMDSCRSGLSPAGMTNDILIAAEIASDAGGSNLREWYTCQVLDLDDDGVYQISDYRTAINGTTATNQISDLVCLNKFEAMADVVRVLEDRNDMFNYPSKVAMGWFGMRAYAAIGDEDVEDSIIYTAKRSLLVSGNSSSHGCHVLIGNTWATRDIVLDDLATKTVTLDGSFIACAACAKQNSFTDPAGTILMKDLAGIFQTMQTYTDAEELTLGGSQVTFLHKEGTAIYRFLESVTTDTSAIDYAEISAMKQKHFMTRYTTKEMAEKLTGWVPPDAYAALTQIRGFLAEIIESAISHGWIAPYGSEQVPPTRRTINPQADILVYQDETIKTDWYYLMWYNLRYPIKRTSGLFGVDSNAILKGASAV